MSMGSSTLSMAWMMPLSASMLAITIRGSARSGSPSPSAPSAGMISAPVSSVSIRVSPLMLASVRAPGAT